MDKAEKFWDRLSRDFNKESDQFDQKFIGKMKNIKNYLKASDTVLDYGCATGRIALELADKVKAVQGIDISSKMITSARNKIETGKINNVSFAHAQIFDKSIKPDSFDVILALNIIHLVKEPEIVIERFNKLLKPDGLLICETPCLGEYKTFLSSIASSLLFITVKMGMLPFISFFKIRELEAIVTNSGFKITNTDRLQDKASTSYFIIAKKI